MSRLSDPLFNNAIVEALAVFTDDIWLDFLATQNGPIDEVINNALAKDFKDFINNSIEKAKL